MNKTNDVIGIEFKRKNRIDDFLNDLFSNIDLKKYIISLSECEIMNKHGLLVENFYRDGRFEKNAYILFMNLKIFKTHNTANTEILNYRDFQKSDCLLIVLISDVEDVEIYFKNNDLKYKILDFLNDNSIKYDEKRIYDDTRTIFSVVWKSIIIKNYVVIMQKNYSHFLLI